MNKTDALLSHYICSDELDRLHLFLAHPDYRVRFLEIDLAKTAPIQPVVRFKWLKRLIKLKPLKMSR